MVDQFNLIILVNDNTITDFPYICLNVLYYLSFNLKNTKSIFFIINIQGTMM